MYETDHAVVIAGGRPGGNDQGLADALATWFGPPTAA
jgi:hypothetical protein